MILRQNRALSSRLAALARRRRARAFTLAEMLVVLVIIALLAALALPAIRGSLESRAIDAASRQLLEDLSLARQRAIAQRGVVAVVFLTDLIFDSNEVPPANANAKEKSEIERLKAGAFTHYAIYQFRRVGEQPGQGSAGYITEWKSLPEGTFFSTNDLMVSSNWTVLNLPRGVRFPFPFSESGYPYDATPIQPTFPYIAFDAHGRSVSVGPYGSTFDLRPTKDLAVAIARGAVFYGRNPDGTLVNNSLELQEIPPYNAVMNRIHIDALTGRAQWVKAEVP